MKKTLFLLSVISILSCKKDQEKDLQTAQYENPEPVSHKDSVTRKTEWEKAPAPSLNELWMGAYNVSVDFCKLDELSEMSIDHDLIITKDSCLFSGLGYKTYFTDLCRLEGDRNQVAIRFIKEIEGDGMNAHPPMDTLAVLLRKEGKYYLKSTIVADKNWKYNTPMLLKKK
ncbi:MAG: DUF5991 domain-containing protein [Chryseobacterium sp.]|jgi:hypothetical protein|uniref:DUF5991 domain-containing protein n=1 Tax=Chryseobacterium sp. TaxID=1871047 RepID=UPI00281ACF0F|nr:DUF5991 domain-containing protein [Chryseobacterium sp.]MDR2235665.1 DUF5991 domain-containing protein [Chryseobacterium sp.]